jgi:hypothetical protein
MAKMTLSRGFSQSRGIVELNISVTFSQQRFGTGYLIKPGMYTSIPGAG